jgi:archaemetzincin
VDRRGATGFAIWVRARFTTVAATLLILVGAAPADAGTYYVRPLGDVEAEQARFACQSIKERFKVDCVVLRAHPLPAKALNRRRHQYDAGALLDSLFRKAPDDAVGLVGVTNADLFDTRHGRFVFGLASLIDRVAVVSLARYRGSWWGQSFDPEHFAARYYKVLVHEVAHTLGLQHCERRTCAMRDDADIAALDASPRQFCSACQAAAAEGARLGYGSPGWHYTRGHAHLHRGQFAQAVSHFELAADRMPDDPRIANDLGVAHLRRGDRAKALWLFRHAARLDPDFPNPRYNEGLVFLGAGAVDQARLAFEATLAIDAGWGMAHRQLGMIFQEFLQKPDKAVAHYDAYLDAHADDYDVAERVRLIKGGGRPQP